MAGIGGPADAGGQLLGPLQVRVSDGTDLDVVEAGQDAGVTVGDHPGAYDPTRTSAISAPHRLPATSRVGGVTVGKTSETSEAAWREPRPARLTAPPDGW